jgi:hypothetical protein
MKLTQPPGRTTIASTDIHVPGEYGKVNHLIITKDKAYRHCSN